MDKQEQTVLFIDVTIPNDHNIIEKRLEKIEKYTDLEIEIKELWNMQRVDISYQSLKDALELLTIRLRDIWGNTSRDQCI